MNPFETLGKDHARAAPASAWRERIQSATIADLVVGGIDDADERFLRSADDANGSRVVNAAQNCHLPF